MRENLSANVEPRHGACSPRCEPRARMTASQPASGLVRWGGWPAEHLLGRLEVPYSQSEPRWVCQGAGVGVASGISLGELRGNQVWRALCLRTQIRTAGWRLKGQSDECVFQLSGELESRVRKGNIMHDPYWGTCTWPGESEVLGAAGWL